MEVFGWILIFLEAEEAELNVRGIKILLLSLILGSLLIGAGCTWMLRWAGVKLFV